MGKRLHSIAVAGTPIREVLTLASPAGSMLPHSIVEVTTWPERSEVMSRVRRSVERAPTREGAIASWYRDWFGV